MFDLIDQGFIETPRDHNAERYVLSGLFNNPDGLLEIQDVIGSQDFDNGQYAEIFTAISELHRDTSPITSVSVLAKLRQTGELPPPMEDMVNECASSFVSGQNLDHYAEIIKQHSMRRELMSVCEQGVSQAAAGEIRAESIHNDIVGRLNDLVSDVRTELQTMKSALKSAFKSVLERTHNPESVKGVKTGFADLDDKTGGFKPGELIILAARPSVGKTALALEIAKNAAKISGEHTIVFSLEMDTQSCMERLMSSTGQIPSDKIRNGGLSPDQERRLGEVTNELYAIPMAFDDAGCVSVWDIKRKARAFKHKHGLGLIVIDYLQLMVGENKNGREREVAEISRHLKILAKELEVPILALSQLNRGLESRQNREPQLSDLRESGAIEQDADVCAFLHREEINEAYENYGGGETRTEDLSEIRLILRKNRHGAIGDIRLSWYPQFTLFTNAEDNFKPATMSSNSAAIKAAAGWQ